MESIVALLFGFCSSALVFHTFNVTFTNIKSIEGVLFCYCMILFTYVWNHLFTSERISERQTQSKTNMDSMV